MIALGAFLLSSNGKRSLLERISNKASKFVSKHVAYNDRYKPVGVRKLRPSANIEFLELRPPYLSTLSLPPQFAEDCSSFAKPDMTVQMPGDFIAILRNGRIYSCDPMNMAVISEDNFLIEELSFQWIPKEPYLVSGEKNIVFQLKGFRRPKRYKGKVFSLLAGGGAKSYYYHWMIDSLAKLALLKESGHFDSVDYFLVPSYKLRYQKESLAQFGIDKDRIIVEDDEPHIEAEYLMISSYVQKKFHHPKWAVDFLYNSFVKQDQRRKRDKLIYIPRGDAAINRRVLNEKELIRALTELGFETHYLAEMTVPDEAILLNSARIVVGIQGSGFTNVVFCEPGTKVLQIFPESYVRHIDCDLCIKKELEYHYLICPSDGVATDTIDGQKINVIADIPAIVGKIRELLNPGALSFINPVGRLL